MKTTHTKLDPETVHHISFTTTFIWQHMQSSRNRQAMNCHQINISSNVVTLSLFIHFDLL